MEVAKNFILSQFVDWAKKIGLVSYEKGLPNGEFAKFQWAYTAPSYLGTFTSYSDGKFSPGFIVADIVIVEKATEDDIFFFIEKVQTLKALKGLSRFIPIIIVNAVSEEALLSLKKNGIVVGFIERLFGKGYSNLLNDLVNTVTNAGAILKKNPDQFIELLKRIDALVDGKTNNLRGDLFEMTVGYYYSKRAKSIDVGKKIMTPAGFQRELDVIAIYEDEIIVAECKAYKSVMSLKEVQDWVDKTRVIRDWLNNIEVYESKMHVFELWSLGGFDISAMPLLERESKAKKYRFAFFEKETILEKARTQKNSKFLAILNEYFIKEPI